MIHIEEIHTAIKSGSSVPVVGKVYNGEFFIKLLGSGDGAYALISEYIINAIAKSLDLPVLSKQLVEITESTRLTVLYEEVRDMVERSLGVNLGYLYYKQDKSLSVQEICDGLSEYHKKYLFLLDVLFRNIDRTSQNHGIIRVNDTLMISDFGVSLIIRSLLDSKTYADSTITKQLLKEHCTYTEDVLDETLEQFCLRIRKIDFYTIVNNIPNIWIKNATSLEPKKTKDILTSLLMRISTEEENLASFLSALKTVEKLNEQEQREKRANNRKKFEVMMNLK